MLRDDSSQSGAATSMGALATGVYHWVSSTRCFGRRGSVNTCPVPRTRVIGVDPFSSESPR